MLSLTPSTTLFLTFTVVVLLASPAYAFGAGNIASVAKVEGVNCKFLTPEYFKL